MTQELLESKFEVFIYRVLNLSIPNTDTPTANINRNKKDSTIRKRLNIFIGKRYNIQGNSKKKERNTKPFLLDDINYIMFPLPTVL
jgi:hypothetical protein